MSITPKPKSKACDWCHDEEPHRWFGGFWICVACDQDFMSRNGRAAKVQEWLRHRGQPTRSRRVPRSNHGD